MIINRIRDQLLIFVILGENMRHWQTMIPCKELSLQWRHNGPDGVSNHQPHDCLLKRLFRRRSKKTPKLRVTGLCEGEFPAQMASNTENISILWRHHHNERFEKMFISWWRRGMVTLSALVALWEGVNGEFPWSFDVSLLLVWIVEQSVGFPLI